MAGLAPRAGAALKPHGPAQRRGEAAAEGRRSPLFRRGPDISRVSPEKCAGTLAEPWAVSNPTPRESNEGGEAALSWASGRSVPGPPPLQPPPHVPLLPPPPGAPLPQPPAASPAALGRPDGAKVPAGDPSLRPSPAPAPGRPSAGSSDSASAGGAAAADPAAGARVSAQRTQAAGSAASSTPAPLWSVWVSRAGSSRGRAALSLWDTLSSLLPRGDQSIGCPAAGTAGPVAPLATRIPGPVSLPSPCPAPTHTQHPLPIFSPSPLPLPSLDVASAAGIFVLLSPRPPAPHSFILCLPVSPLGGAEALPTLGRVYGEAGRAADKEFSLS